MGVPLRIRGAPIVCRGRYSEGSRLALAVKRVHKGAWTDGHDSRGHTDEGQCPRSQHNGQKRETPLATLVAVGWIVNRTGVHVGTFVCQTRSASLVASVASRRM